ncbi:hypothetical protein C5167_045187 [Papaver somniferum]|uniref:Uncharacterized protein n=1 Tax=Papaver somniferum TaxID=3469 RepID=A0A4Y7LDX9_PAPSO|nr:hypothetical protein C5167_045187 [Papaver somniferum]
MASIHDEPEISPEEEEHMKNMARYRDHLIAKTIERRERAAKEAIAAGARARKEMVIARQVLPRKPLVPIRKLMEWRMDLNPSQTVIGCGP